MLVYDQARGRTCEKSILRPALKSTPCASLRKGGTTREYFPSLPIVMYGFSDVRGVLATEVMGTEESALLQCEGGAPSTPATTMFHTPPCQCFTSQFRANHCC